MKQGIVACPVHGDNETTPNCPNCRRYMDKKMKQRITVEQLNELSEKGKKILRGWWEPKVGDKFITKYSSTYVIYGENDLDSSGDQLLTDQPVDSGYYGWNNYENFPPDKDSIEKTKRYKEVREDALPLLSIGQMIEFLSPYSQTFIIEDHGTNWKITFDVVGVDKEPVTKRIELYDALWEAVKEILNK